MNFGHVCLAFDKRLPELETAGDPAPTATATWQRRMRFRGLKFDSDTSGAAAVFATVRSGAARRNQEI